MGVPLLAEIGNNTVVITIMIVLNVIALIAAYFLRMNPTKQSR
jgi:hypothetical protein